MHTLRERYAAAAQAAHEIHAKAEAEDRPMNDDERAEFDSHVAEARELKAKVVQSDDDRGALNELGDLVPMDGEPSESPKGSLGERFLASPEYAALMKQHGGKISDSTQRVQMDAVRMGDFQAALLNDPGLTAPTHRVAPESLQIVDLLDVITVIPDSPSVIKTFTGAFVSAAAETAEGAVKPESSYTWTDETVTLATDAHHIPVTNQALGHNPTLRNRIDTHLVNGVRARLQARVAARLAAGTGMQAQAFDTDMTTTIRRAVTKADDGAAQLGAGPSSILLSTADAEAIDLEQLAHAAYAPGQGPQQQTSLWRRQIVTSANLPAGFCYVGDLSQIELHLGSDIQVTTGWIDDQFIRNQVTLLGEVEAAATIFGAGALVRTALSV